MTTLSDILYPYEADHCHTGVFEATREIEKHWITNQINDTVVESACRHVIETVRHTVTPVIADGRCYRVQFMREPVWYDIERSKYAQYRVVYYSALVLLEYAFEANSGDFVIYHGDLPDKERVFFDGTSEWERVDFKFYEETIRTLKKL